jgi:hypothetical protein
VTDNSFGRLAGALVSPGSTFESISKKPTWLVALLVLMLSAGALGLVVHEKTNYQEVTTRALEARGRLGTMSGEQVDQVVEMQERFGAVGAGVGALVAGILYCVIAVFYWMVFRLMGSELTYKQSLATYVYGSLPMVLYVALAILVLSGRGELSYEEITARDFLASHLGFLAPAGSGLVLRSFLTGIDFFALWSVVLLAIGYRIVARVSATTAGVVVTLFYLVSLGVRVGFTWLGAGGAG